ncbi:MAG TPA: M20 family metallopeptidase [Acidimicrobiales bacterium]|nr:M20 family metallopeptidase [Acidimicrobiales bacterium]
MDAKTAAQRVVSDAGSGLVELSHTVHDHPELAFEEERAAAWVADALSGPFSVEAGVCDLPTAFVATAGSGPFTIAICAEYDALPGIGHACGHNVIAAAAVGAGLALAPIADELGITVKVMGTPAEEKGGGKILMLQRGAFAGVHAAMMVHPSSNDDNDHMPCLAIQDFEVHYHGKAAHASAFPELGLNAADALTIAQTSIGLLRQHIKHSDRIHGIVLHGGDAPNVVPHETAGRWYVRSKNMAQLAELEPRVVRCFEAGALATGCTVDVVKAGPAYSEFEHDKGLAALYRANAEALGRKFVDLPEEIAQRFAGSTDMANISLAMPAIHPMLGLDCFPAVNHQPEFTAACVTPKADQAVIDGAIGMAWTVIDAATDDATRARLMAGQRA